MNSFRAITALSGFAIAAAAGVNNGLSRTPAMGFNGYNAFA
jgi:hypothetical protein